MNFGWAKLQNTGPIIYILLNNDSAYWVILRCSKGFDTNQVVQSGPAFLVAPNLELIT